jgi:L-amino acid N-acyltransferase YncA
VTKSPLHIRRAGALDCRALAALLNEIIAIGGTTAKVELVTSDQLSTWMEREHAVWHLAEDDTGKLLGFQYIQPHKDIPHDSTDIATFTRVGQTGLGIGSALFAATRKAAIDMGYVTIDAVIRADNEGGLAYYQSRGFETIKLLKDEKLSNGQVVDRVWKRCSLR